MTSQSKLSRRKSAWEVKGAISTKSLMEDRLHYKNIGASTIYTMHQNAWKFFVSHNVNTQTGRVMKTNYVTMSIKVKVILNTLNFKF